MPPPVPPASSSPAAAGDWTIVHRIDPAMDLHLALLADAAEDALRDRHALDALDRGRCAAPGWRWALAAWGRRSA